MLKETIEYQVGELVLTKTNLLISNIEDFEMLEYWEERLKSLKEPFAVTFKTLRGKISYSVYANLKDKNSSFRGNHA